MKIVIVGGGGFIGSALVARLSAAHECVCFGHGGRFEELRALARGRVEFVEGDVTDGVRVREAVHGAGAVLHVAGTGGEADCLAAPARAVLTHVHGTHVLLREAMAAGVGRFMFASTIAVYGTYRARPQPLSEEHEPLPDDFYGALKFAAEREVFDSGRGQVFRLANVYGDAGGLEPASGSVADKFVGAVATGAPMKIFGEGSQLIDYVHVADVCRAFEEALGNPPRPFVYNLGGGRPVSIRDLSAIVEETAAARFGVSACVEQVPAPAQKLWPDRWLSIEKIGRETGWRPRVTLEEGLARMLARKLGREES